MSGKSHPDAKAPTDAPAQRLPVDPLIRLREAMNAERQAIQDLIRENGRLRRENDQWRRATTELAETLHSTDPMAPPPGNAPGTATLSALGNYVRELGEKTSQTFHRDEILRQENSNLVEQCQELMKENNNLFKLYVASRHLHSTLVLDEVLQVISEIIQDIIGASDYAIFLHDERAASLVPRLARGPGQESLTALKVADLEAALAGASGGSYITNEPPEDGSPQLDRPLVLISLQNETRLLGAIAIYRLLSQKPDFTDVDYALFDFFAGHAATALFSARLFSQTEGKVKKMKEFLTMMSEG